jgi:hypothetical protein
MDGDNRLVIAALQEFVPRNSSDVNLALMAKAYDPSAKRERAQGHFIFSA